MIQRIQTVYLFLGALALAAMGGFDTPWDSTAAATLGWYTPTVLGLLVVTIGTALGSIFLYTQRKTQRSVVVGAQVLTVGLAGVLYGGLYMTEELHFGGAVGLQWDRTVALLLPVLAYGLFWLARRGIDHDIELVKSMDRLR
ncbi:MAG: DUF4293 family protein [Salinivenus sp.]